MSVEFRLPVEFHGKTERVDQDHDEYSVLEQRRGNKGPQFVLDGILGDVASHWFGIQCKFYAVPL